MSNSRILVPTHGLSDFKSGLPSPAAKRRNVGTYADYDETPSVDGAGVQGFVTRADAIQGLTNTLGRINASGGDQRSGGQFMTAKIRSDPVPMLVPEGSVFTQGDVVLKLITRDEKSVCLTLPVLNALLRKSHERREKKLEKLANNRMRELGEFKLEDLVGVPGETKQVMYYAVHEDEWFDSIRTVDDLMAKVSVHGLYVASSQTPYRGTGVISSHDIYRYPATITSVTEGRFEAMMNYANANLGDTIYIVAYRDHPMPEKPLMLKDNYGPLQLKFIASRGRPAFMSSPHIMFQAFDNYNDLGRDTSTIADMVTSLRNPRYDGVSAVTTDWRDKGDATMSVDTHLRDLVFDYDPETKELLALETVFVPPVIQVARVLNQNMTFGSRLPPLTIKRALVDGTGEVITRAQNTLVVDVKIRLLNYVG